MISLRSFTKEGIISVVARGDYGIKISGLFVRSFVLKKKRGGGGILHLANENDQVEKARLTVQE